MSVFVIAEAGVNHNGDVAMAHKLVDVAAQAGADAVKFQTFQPKELVVSNAPKAAYQKITTEPTESQLDMLGKLQLGKEAHIEVMQHCQSVGIQFLSTPFDLPSLDFLVNDLDLPVIKIPSGELTNAPLILAVAHSGRNVILSTGMSTLDQVREALGVLAYGFQNKMPPTGRSVFLSVLDNDTSHELLRDKVTLLHCTTEYPTPPDHVNLKAMDTLSDAFGIKIGYSDHTDGVAVSVAAVARGAQLIEKHITLDKALPGPDHMASLEPLEFTRLVEEIRSVEAALGDGEKKPQGAELENADVARKSLVAIAAVGKGEVFTTANLGVKRPGTGVSPMEFYKWIGRPSPNDLSEGDIFIL